MTAALERLLTLRDGNNAARAVMDGMRPRFERLAGRHENGTAPRAVSAFQLFQTPPEVAQQLAALLGLPAGARVLEPSAGLGRLLDALEPHKPGEVVAVEVSPDLCRELRKRPVCVVENDFLNILPDDLGHFDAVLMNPPFHLRADIRHIEHGLDFLKPGGTLAAICMDTDRRAKAFRDRADKWVPLPCGTFRAEGTDVATVMFTLKP